MGELGRKKKEEEPRKTINGPEFNYSWGSEVIYREAVLSIDMHIVPVYKEQ